MTKRRQPSKGNARFHGVVSGVKLLLLLALLLIQCCLVAPSIDDNHAGSTHNNTTSDASMKVLYIMTTLSEFDTGKRATSRGSDRLKKVVLPVLTEGVASMVGEPHNYNVDVYLILGYTLKEERVKMIRDALPSSVGLEIWHDATPLAIDWGRDKNGEKLVPVSRSLARQHRFVIKDKLMDYDFFVVFEDDMLIKGDHVAHYVAVSKELERLKEETSLHGAPGKTPKWKLDKHFYGELNKQQLSRMIPGFIRVEVLLDEEKFGTQENLAPLPVDRKFLSKNGTVVEQHINPETCCHVSSHTANDHIPERTTFDKAFLWETAIHALGIREMPESSWLSWVAMQTGPQTGRLQRDAIIGDYWSGRAYPELGKRPYPGDPKYINNQGGWMATREQIWEWHTNQCLGGFLPPFDWPHYSKYDGLDLRNVEYWSGGIQIAATKNSCSLQRIIVLEPESFSKHLIYHTANNKQRQLRGRKGRFVKADNLLGQLNAVRKKAQIEKLKETGNTDHISVSIGDLMPQK